MFSTKPAPAVEPAHDDDVDRPPADLIPLSHLSLDLEVPAAGWDAFLTVRGIAVLTDDLGRKAISRADARQLFDEQREEEARRREVAARREEQLIEADRVRRASIWGGMPADAIPEGVSAAHLWAQAEKDAKPRRVSPLEHALSGGGVVFHPIQEDGNGS